MMADFMTGFCNRTYQMRMTRSLLTDQKKRCVCLMLPESRQNAGRIIRIRSIIDRQPYLALPRFKTGNHAKQTLRSGNKDMVEHQKIGGKKE